MLIKTIPCRQVITPFLRMYRKNIELSISAINPATTPMIGNFIGLMIASNPVNRFISSSVVPMFSPNPISPPLRLSIAIVPEIASGSAAANANTVRDKMYNGTFSMCDRFMVL